MEKIQFEDYKEPYLNAETLNQMQNNIATAIDEKGSGSGIHIGTDEPTDTNVWINPDEPLNVMGTEVVDSLSGDETNKAPSVRAIKEFISNKNVYSEEETIIGYVIKNGKKIPLYRKELRYIGTIANDVTVNHGIDNLDEMFNAYGWVRKYGWMPIPTVHNYLAGFIGFGAFNSTTFTWYVGSDIQAGLVDVLIKVTLEYTKTTDL